MPARNPAGARKNPLRVVGDPVPTVGPSGVPAAVVAAPTRTAYTPRELRQLMISEFADWLRIQTNKQRRPFQEETILAYSNAALALSTWKSSRQWTVPHRRRAGVQVVALGRRFTIYDLRFTDGTRRRFDSTGYPGLAFLHRECEKSQPAA